MMRWISPLPWILLILAGCAGAKEPMPLPEYRDGRLDRMFYHPDRGVYDQPSRFGLSFTDVIFPSGDGTSLHGWWLPAVGDARGTVVHVHGNAANVSAHLSAVSWLPARGYHVFLFDYRGFGKSEGVPGRRGIQLDLEAAVAYAREREGADPDRLVLFGQSLGGTVAIWGAGSGRLSGVRGLVTEGAFYAYRSMAGDAAGLLRLFTLGIRNTFSPSEVITRIEVPHLIVHGTADQVVPFSQGRKLARHATDPTTFWPVEAGRHMDTFVGNRPDTTASRDRLVTFIEACLEE